MGKRSVQDLWRSKQQVGASGLMDVERPWQRMEAKDEAQKWKTAKEARCATVIDGGRLKNDSMVHIARA